MRARFRLSVFHLKLMSILYNCFSQLPVRNEYNQIPFSHSSHEAQNPPRLLHCLHFVTTSSDMFAALGVDSQTSLPETLKAPMRQAYPTKSVVRCLACRPVWALAGVERRRPGSTCLGVVPLDSVGKTLWLNVSPVTDVRM